MAKPERQRRAVHSYRKIDVTLEGVVGLDLDPAAADRIFRPDHHHDLGGIERRLELRAPGRARQQYAIPEYRPAVSRQLLGKTLGRIGVLARVADENVVVGGSGHRPGVYCRRAAIA